MIIKNQFDQSIKIKTKSFLRKLCKLIKMVSVYYYELIEKIEKYSLMIFDGW